MINFINKKKYLKKQLKRQPDNVNLLNELAITLIELNNYEQAYKCLKKAYDLKKGVKQLNNLAYFYYAECKPTLVDGEYEWEDANKEAIELLKEAIALNPNSHFPYDLLGEILLYAEKDDKAADYILKAIEIKPTMNNLNNMGVYYYQKSNFREAAEYFRKATEYSINSLTPLLNYGICLAELNHKEEALQVGEELLELNEELGDVSYQEISFIYYIIKEYQKFEEAFTKDDIMFLCVEWYPPYLYGLYQLGKLDEMNQFVEGVIQKKEREMQDSMQDEDQDWEEGQLEEYLEEEKKEIAFLKAEKDKVLEGICPGVDYEASYEKDCYLFGCMRHENPKSDYRF